MNIIRAENLICPLDNLHLIAQGQQLACPDGHSFDVARRGYVNLLPVQHKRSKEPGDSEEMVVARREFLDSGAYDAIAQHLASVVLHTLPPDTMRSLCLLDAGCGEGFYLSQLQSVMQADSRPQDISLIGMDISKPAIHAATRRSKAITWLIASNRQPPVAEGSVDIILCMFGFPIYERFMHILKPGGRLIQVEADSEHLIELRRIIYPSVNVTPAPTLDAAQAAGFSVCEETHVQSTTDLHSTTQIMNLLKMTPHYFRASTAGKEHLAALQELTLTIDVVFRVLQREQ